MLVQILVCNIHLRTLSELPLLYSREYKYELQICLYMYQNSLLLAFWKYQWNKKYRLVIHANLVFIFLISQSRGLTTFLQADSEYWDQCYGKSSVEMQNTPLCHPSSHHCRSAAVKRGWIIFQRKAETCSHELLPFPKEVWLIQSLWLIHSPTLSLELMINWNGLSRSHFGPHTWLFPRGKRG